ncbi:MAG: histidine kinase dimerization/phosphoacceptor domain -containing protein, partial [Gracilimonas sp.]
MIQFVEKYRLLVSLIIGLILSLAVLLLWWGNTQSINQAQAQKVQDTGQLIVQQFEKALHENINTLENLKNRIEITNGQYFDFWKYDAEMILNQDSSFLFVEWIDSSMVIQMVEPIKGNEEAIGLDISKLDYRNEDWTQTRQDSIINITHWLELVQGQYAFLVDAPVYFDNTFQGTITAGINPSERFDNIMQGLNQYYVKIDDGKGTTFYQFGDSTGTASMKKLQMQHRIGIAEINMGNWQVCVVPNEKFRDENAALSSILILELGLILSILVAVLFYFMLTAYKAQKSSRYANEKIRALIESSPMAIYSIDTNGVVKDFWNEAAEEMLGWSREEVLGKFMPHVAGEWEGDFLKLMNKTLKDGTIENKEIIRHRKDGSPIQLRLNVGQIVGEKEGDQQMLAILEDITKEKEYQQQLKNSVREKEVLLSEVHHRVKNNLAIIIGLIELQKGSLDNKKLEFILNETQNRIYSISGVHELLYNTDSFTEITFEDYAVKLIQRLRGTFKTESDNIEIDHHFDTRNLNINQAIPLGLLLNELITNSFKHAFEDQSKGNIKVE